MPILFKTKISTEAAFRVNVTDIRSSADLVAFKTENRWEATSPVVWHFTELMVEADKVVFFSEIRSDADIVVYWTDILSDAEWLNDAKSKLL